MATKPRILLVEPLDEDADRRLDAGAEVVRPPATDEATLCRLVADCEGLVARTDTAVTAALLEAGKRLRVVGVAGVGLDRVDVVAAEKSGIAVLHTPAAASDAVAEFTMALMLQLLRPVLRLAGAYKEGQFRSVRDEGHGRELRELTVGIVGMGRIGSRVGRIASAGLGATVLYNDIVEVGPFAFEATAVDKPTLWSQSDIVTLHVPATEMTRELVNADVLARMRPSAYLINTARGVVVDTAALTAALQGGQIAAAALDVVEPEPLPPEHPLFAMENCVLTPHVAARTHDGLRRMYAVVDDVLAFLTRS
ncbi:MAG: NAD(P)-dependent oxidoreductase [Phycisphaerae bacterium]